MNSNFLKKATVFTRRAHDSINQRRKYSDEPYYVHVERVAKLISTITDDEEVIAAGLLHDVLEDVAPHNPNYCAEVIRDNFGDRVLKLVLEVTDVSKPSDGNREVRKAIDKAHLAKASPDGKTIKIADLIDNIIDISKHDEHFAKIFKKEAFLELDELRAGNKKLFDMLEGLLFP